VSLRQVHGHHVGLRGVRTVVQSHMSLITPGDAAETDVTGAAGLCRSVDRV
jgi:hypothetical protein